LRSAARRELPEWRFLLAAFAGAALVVVSRRPDAFTNPQFYLEDGLWYANAHEWGGLRSLLTPYRGYLVTVQRLGGWLAQAFPLAAAPLLLSSLAVFFHTLPAVLLCSSRFAHVLPDRRVRALIALFYLAVPNSWSTISNITHAQWHLAALGCLVLLAMPADRLSWKAFDVAALVLGGLSGPFAIFLTPIAVFAWRRHRSRWRLALVLIVATTAVVQAVMIVSVGTGTQGPRPALGASVTGFFAVWTKQVVYGAFIGQRGLEALYHAGSTLLSAPLLILLGSVALVAMTFAAIRGPFELRMILLMAACIFGAALALPPPMSLPIGYWESISYPAAGNRYFLLPIFALGLSFSLLLREKHAVSRVVARVALVGIALGIVLDWKQPALRDFHFARYVGKYESAAPGEKVQIPYPTGWGITLTKTEREVSGQPRRAAASRPKAKRPGIVEAFRFGVRGRNVIPLIGDWDGDGVATVGLYLRDNALFHLAGANEPGEAKETFFFGVPRQLPVVGDWDGDGEDTIGVYVPENGTFHLSNVNAAGDAPISVSFGAPNLTPLAGDWDGDGKDTVGVYVPEAGTFFLTNANTAGEASISVTLGAPNLRPLAGDWDGDGKDSVGVYASDAGMFYLTNRNVTGVVDMAFSYGPPNRAPLAGDWDGDGKDSVGVYDPADGTFYLGNVNAKAHASLARPSGHRIVSFDAARSSP
jgi:hypothetical protein